MRLLNGVISQPFYEAFDGRGTLLVEDLFLTNQTLLSFPDSGIPQITIIALTAHWYFGIDNISFARAGSNFRLKAAVLKPDDTPAIVERRDLPAGGGNVAQPLQFDLGERVQLSVVQVNPDGTDGAEVPGASFTADARPEDQVPQDPANLFSAPTVLFPGNFLIGFTQAQNQFFAIHSGNPNLTVSFEAPGASSKTTVSVPVEISASGFSLGTSQNDFDNLILEFADLRGIPPQILKAQIGQETANRFRADTYRYEPLSQDFGEVSSGPKNLREDPRFKPWRLATFPDFVNRDPAGLPQGSALAADPTALQIRQRFKVFIGAGGLPVQNVVVLASQGVDPDSFSIRSILPGDPPVSMENILFVNESQQHWIIQCDATGCHLTGSFLNWYNVRRRSRLVRVLPEGLFTAQPVIAASYGLMQVTYITAVDQMQYTEADGTGFVPDSLWEPDISVDLGTEYLAVQYAKNFDPNSGVSSMSDLQSRFRTALRFYNSPRKSPSFYAQPILDSSKNYLPLRR